LEKYQKAVALKQEEIAGLEAGKNNFAGTLSKSLIDDFSIFEELFFIPQPGV
jgi:hypothetical protein